MSSFIKRNLLSTFIVAIVLSIALSPSLLDSKADIISTIWFVFLYSLLFILLYGVPASIVVELLSLLQVFSSRRILVKVLVYFAFLIIFTCFSLPLVFFVIYAAIGATLYFLIDEYFRNKS